MIDPMANIDTPVGGGPGGEMEAGEEVFDVNAFKSNLRKIDKIRSFMGIISGCVAGVCGLTGLSGLGEYVTVLLYIYLYYSLCTVHHSIEY